MRLGGTSKRCQLAFLALTAVLSALSFSCGSDPAPQLRDASRTPSRQPVDSGGAVLGGDEADNLLGLANMFLDAAGDKNYERMWELLSPGSQAQWPSEESFAGFLRRKFGAEKVDVRVGELQADADGQRARLPVSLKVAGGDSQLAGPPLVLVRQGEAWAVSDGGPLGRDGPLFGTPAPVRSELDVPILTYHHVATELPADREQGNITVTTNALADQLGWLADSGHSSISVAELYNAFYYDLPLPEKPVILVFDDGYADVYERAFPLLVSRDFRATVAAITNAMDKPNYLTWDQAREMSKAGVEFVSHTLNHANLSLLSRDEARPEIADSRSALEAQLGRPVQFFVYPYGEPFTSGSDQQRQTVEALLREAGYRGALTTSSGPPYFSLQTADAPYRLHRIPVSGGESVERFAASIEG